MKLARELHERGLSVKDEILGSVTSLERRLSFYYCEPDRLSGLS